MTRIRINRFLAQRGVASRRSADRLIQEGRVTVNGLAAVLGTVVDPAGDSVAVDRRAVAATPRMETLMLNKPVGVVTTTRDPQGRPTVMSLLGEAGRIPGLAPVGRLDADTRGLLLLSSDGELAHRLTHPRFGVVKRYRVTLERPASAEDLEQLVRGRRLLDGPARAVSARWLDRGAPHVVEVEMSEGRKREVRRLCAALGMEVRDLARVGVGPVRLDGLEEGRWRRLSASELRALRGAAGAAAEGLPESAPGDERAPRQRTHAAGAPRERRRGR